MQTGNFYRNKLLSCWIIFKMIVEGGVKEQSDSGRSRQIMKPFHSTACVKIEDIPCFEVRVKILENYLLRYDAVYSGRHFLTLFAASLLVGPTFRP